jgi:hypothetical protein
LRNVKEILARVESEGEQKPNNQPEDTMNKPLLGLMLGGVLGIFDGLTALFYPETAPMIRGIVIGSTIKGLITGVAIGYFARKVNSLPLGIVFGLGVGLLLAFLVAAMPEPSGKHYYFEIMLPGGILGMIVGFATQKYNEKPRVKAARS